MVLVLKGVGWLRAKGYFGPAAMVMPVERTKADALAWDLKPAVESLARAGAVTEQVAADTILAVIEAYLVPS